MKKNKPNTEIKAIISAFKNAGWRKSDYQLYRFMDPGRRYIISAIIDTGAFGIPKDSLGASISFHDKRLTDLAYAVKEFDQTENSPDSEKKLNITNYLRGFNRPPLVAVKKIEIYNGNLEENFVEICNKDAENIYEEYSDLEKVSKLYEESNVLIYDRDCLLINLFLKRYSKVRKIFKEYHEPFDGRGNWDIIRYMDYFKFY
ncbi:hypothetical protein [Consotaella aegiceratis]|uniref:hypothetical protein n=1 Tax=Consotaella aegiceratis TaxID=3097961 RepID=UPI002F41FEB3